MFDIDGTLIRTGGAGVTAFGLTFLHAFGLQEATRKLVFSGRTDVSLVRECFALHGIPATEENFGTFFGMYPHWLDHMLKQLDGGPCEGVHEFMRQARALEKPPLFGLLTGNVRLGAELKLRRYDLWQEFKVGGFGCDHESRNEIAAVARDRGLRHLGEPLRPEEVLVLGDTPLDIECAKHIGAKSLAVATGSIPIDTLLSHRPDWAVADLRHISAAEACA